MVRIPYHSTAVEYPSEPDPKTFNLTDFLEEFRERIRSEDGAVFSGKFICDGEWNRFSLKKGDAKKSGRYRIFTDGKPHATFWNWRTDQQIYHQGNVALTDADRERLSLEAKKRKEQNEAKNTKAREEAAAEARLIKESWAPASPDHPYLQKKNVKPHGLFQRGDTLVILMECGGHLVGGELVEADGRRSSIPGTPKKGAYHIIGEPREKVCIAEGWATAASIHEATGYACIVSFGAGNLLAVAKAFEGFPGEVIVCADDDWQHTNQRGEPENIGLIRASEAALAVGGWLATTAFGEGREDKDTDFNDMARLHGFDAVRECIERAACVEAKDDGGGENDEEKSSFDARSFFDFVERGSVNNVDGMLAELRDFILHHSPIYQNRAMALGSAISIISALAGRTLASPTACALNLYVALIAPTGGGKNFPLNAPGKVFAALDARGIVTGSFASAAAIEERLNVIPTVLAAIDEFGNQLLARFTGNRASTHEQALGGVIRSLWTIGFDTYDGTNAVARGGAKSIDSPHLVLLGAATHAEFYEALGSGNVSNGLLNRLLIIDAPPSVEREDDAPFRVCISDDLLKGMRAILPGGDPACLLSPAKPDVTQIPWAPDGAKEAWTGFRREINRRTALAPEIEPFIKRTAEQAIRLASLHAIGCRGRNAKVTLNDVKWGIAFSSASSQVMIEGAQQYIAENEAQKKARLVQSALIEIWKKKKAPAATRSQLYRKIDGKITARDIDGIAAALEEAGFLTIVVSEPSKKGGRRGTSYVKGGAL